MPLDRKLEEAVREAVLEYRQSPKLSVYLVAWLNEVISGNEDLSQKQQADRHLELLYAETAVSQNSSDGEN